MRSRYLYKKHDGTDEPALTIEDVLKQVTAGLKPGGVFVMNTSDFNRTINIGASKLEELYSLFIQWGYKVYIEVKKPDVLLDETKRKNGVCVTWYAVKSY